MQKEQCALQKLINFRLLPQFMTIGLVLALSSIVLMFSILRVTFIREILIKLEIASSLLHVKREIAQIIKKVKSTKGNSTCRIHIDVDPS